MAICPECRAAYGDDVQTCPQHGCELVPDDLFLPDDVPLPEGTMVGEYRIQRKLGAGAFGDVYAGEQPLIGKRVAIKVLNRRFASDPVMVSRFVAEARAVNRIRQRNIIDIFSFGMLEEHHRHYFVMELLDGLTLGELMIQRGRLPIGLTLPIVRDIADALDAVHEAGITHRDLKPDNVFLATQRDGTYFPKLLDFGIAKLVGDDAAHKTGPGMVLGTPRYMSPEQARGKVADHRADVYALGAMIHEMLTGRPLFIGESGLDVLLMQATDAPPSMSSVRADLPPVLDGPVLAMLEKNPKDRPSSAGQAVAALIAAAEKMGFDRADATIANSPPGAAAKAVWKERGGAKPAARAAPAAASAQPQHGGTTVTLAASDVAAILASEGPPSVPEAEASRAPSAPIGVGAGALSSDHYSGRSAQSTEGLSAVETSSAIARLERARRWKIGAGSLAAIAVGLSIWSLGRGPQRGPEGSVPHFEAPAGSTAPLAAVPVLPASAEPQVKPDVAAPELVEVRLATHPPDAEVWLGERRLGIATDPVTLPRGSEHVSLALKKAGYKDEAVTLTPDRNQSLEATLAPLPARRSSGGAPKPAPSSGRIDKLLEARD